MREVRLLCSALPVLARRRFKRRSIVDLQAATHGYLAKYPKPFVWTKPAAQILAKLNRLSASVHMA